MSKSTRISISLPTKLYYEFDEALKGKGYSSRSSIIQDAMKDYIEQYGSTNEIKGKYIGIISIIYDYQSRALENISHIKNEYNICINSVIQTRLNSKQFMELIVVKGDIKCITKLSNKLMGIKIVEEVKLTTIFLDRKS